MSDYIVVRGAAEHNLKSVDVQIPRLRLSVVTGLSGSGKSSLAYDVIYREGQRRFVESLSSYARQYMGRLDKPRVEHIEGLSPTISIDQKTISRNPRSTVGTVTEILDHLRLLFARLGTPHCPNCSAEIASRTVDQIVDSAYLEWPGREVMIAAPMILDRKGEYRKEIDELREQGFVRVRIDGEVRRLDEEIALARYERHTIEVLYDRVRLDPARRARVAESVERSLEIADGLVNLVVDEENHLRSSRFACPACEISVPELEPRLFSFNSPHGACPDCEGLGRIEYEDGELEACETCDGARLRAEARSVLFHRQNLVTLSAQTVEESLQFFGSLGLQGNEALIGDPIVREIEHRLRFMNRVGLGYLNLDRGADTLSGGEAQRIRLASQLGSGLRGVLYVLDEPSIGLHPRDNTALLETLRELRDLGNTVLVVEHDRETIEAADHIIDVGPGAGVHGGEVIANGSLTTLRKAERSVTARYLTGKASIELPEKRRRASRGDLTVRGARQHNLRGIDVAFPIGLLTVVTGVSGSGKSTLVERILHRAVRRELGLQGPAPGTHDGIDGVDQVDKVIQIDQSPIGRTPRSNPGTYTKVFDDIRDLFALAPESKVRGYRKGRFSFNVKGGRCENCCGAGVITISMQFLADVDVPCEECDGKRYNTETLQITYRGKNIAEVLDLPIEEAHEFFRDLPKIERTLRVLVEVGLGYVRIGQPSTTLSGGEAQRVKLAHELRKVATGRTLYLLDEPTTGLHFEDIKRLLAALQRLVDQGNTVVVIEHNLDVAKVADHVIDLGPEGGAGGGKLVARGTPEKVARSKGPTGVALALALAGEVAVTSHKGKKARCRQSRSQRPIRHSRCPREQSQEHRCRDST